ncbi:hypothetical protein [Flavobacterium sp. 25HG05S-40]|jgi:hypothetical protein|uniref:hypothetical protein n=1 Tax=Flavobacterium sp. 25HG05S-40 TaxID=3458682 RepID=UPI004043C45D
MNYEKEYQYFYNRYYSKSEKLIKQLLITEKIKGRNVDIVYNKLGHYLTTEFPTKILATTNPKLKDLLQLFEKRFKYYEVNEISSIFTYEIKTSFNKIEVSELPVGYTIRKLLIEIAILNILDEISRLLLVNRSLFNRFYQLDDFTDFEIKDYKGLSVEDTSIYRVLNEKLYPDSYTNTDYEDFDFEEPEKANEKGYSLPVVIALLNEIGFFELEKIKNLSPTSLAKIIAIIQLKDPNNKTTNRAISGNIRVLNPDNKEDGFKYTSHKHAEKVKAVLNEIKQGNQ